MYEDDPITIADKIEGTIALIDSERRNLDHLARDKAQAQSDYDRAMTLTVLKLNNGHLHFQDHEPIGKIVQSNIPLIAKGICWRECLEKESTDALYKACISNLEALKAQLNGLQSINRYLTNT